MIKRISKIILFILFFFLFGSQAQADHLQLTDPCNPTVPHCIPGLYCQYKADTDEWKCLAPITAGRVCDSSNPNGFCASNLLCQLQSDSGEYKCIRPLPAGSAPSAAPSAGSAASVFGNINTPDAIKNLGVGSAGISKFLNSLVILIYMLASVVFTFMILWGASQWIISGGDKEAVAGARNRIIHAVIGIMLFAAAFALIQILGTFTGFKFF